MTTQEFVPSYAPTHVQVAVRRSSGNRTLRVLIYVVLVFLSVLFMIPVYMVLVTSVKSLDQVNLTTMWELPTRFTTESITGAFSRLAPNFLNSALMAIWATAFSSVIGSLNGYVLSKWRFRHANLLFTLMLFGMFIPYQAILIPLVQFMQFLGLYGSLAGLALTHIVYGIPITTLIFRNYYAKIPTELLEAGAIDGAGFFGLYRWVILPISAPAYVVVVIWQFTQIWNEFLFGVTLTNVNSQPVTVALQNLSGSQILEWNVQMAGAFLTALPTLLIYVLLGRYFIRGLLAGSVKG
jgi:glucose/mannose transport system permease protein